MSKVFVLNHDRQPLTPCSPAKARKLLTGGKAAVLRRFPFTIILREQVENPTAQPVRMKLDPGSKTTGLALVNDHTGEVLFAAELEHRGEQIKNLLASRRAIRRSRRNRHCRYRKPRFANRRRKEGCLPPSLESRVANLLTWVERIRRVCPLSALSVELVRFDTQLMQNPEISGIEYQQGELAGYEIRQYLLEKFGHQCAYCKVKGVPLEIEHIIPKSRGGTNRVSNLAIACQRCNQKKGNLTAEEFGHPEVQAQAKAPLRDAAAVNTTRWELCRRLLITGLPVETGSGGRTKFNRIERGLPKAHWIDAACVGASTPENLHDDGAKPIHIKAAGHGSRQMCRMDRYGFPRTSAKAAKKSFGFQTGDIVKAVVKTGEKAGIYVGKVAIRASGWFNIVTSRATVQGISRRDCKVIHHCDGYTYERGTALLRSLKSAVSAPGR